MKSLSFFDIFHFVHLAPAGALARLSKRTEIGKHHQRREQTILKRKTHNEQRISPLIFVMRPVPMPVGASCAIGNRQLFATFHQRRVIPIIYTYSLQLSYQKRFKTQALRRRQYTICRLKPLPRFFLSAFRHVFDNCFDIFLYARFSERF